MKKILVTGGAGNIGSALVERLSCDSQNTIIVADNLSTGSIDKIVQKGNVVFLKVDINDIHDISPLFFKYNFDYVFHYAAVVGVDRTLKNPLQVFNDIKGIENILKLSKNTAVKRVFYSSSSEVYGEPFELPQNEKSTPLNSRLPYAIVKNLGESYCKTYSIEYGLNYTIFRFFNTYGPRQNTDFVIPKFIKRALSDHDIEIFGDGLQTRTFCYVQDNVDACVNALYHEKYINDVVNIGSDDERTIIDVADLVLKLSESKSKIVHLPPLKEGDMTRRKPDITKMKNLLNREIIKLEEGIIKLINYYKNENRIQSRKN